MKKLTALLLMLIIVLAFAACGTAEEDPMIHGVNAVITGIDGENGTITVKDADENGILGLECDIDCSGVPVIYYDDETQELCDLTFDDLEVGDPVILNIRASELEPLQAGDSDGTEINVEQIQLGTWQPS